MTDKVITCEQNAEGVFESVTEIKTKPIKRMKKNLMNKKVGEDNIDKFFNGFDDGLEVIDKIAECLRLW